VLLGTDTDVHSAPCMMFVCRYNVAVVSVMTPLVTGPRNNNNKRRARLSRSDVLHIIAYYYSTLLGCS